MEQQNPVPNIDLSEMKMPEGTEMPTTKTSAALTVTIIALLIAVLGALGVGLYLWYSNMQSAMDTVTPTAISEENVVEATGTNDMMILDESTTTIEATPLSTSDSISDIQADLNATSFSDIDADFSAMDAAVAN